jgi:hypothetical protein
MQTMVGNAAYDLQLPSLNDDAGTASE